MDYAFTGQAREAWPTRQGPPPPLTQLANPSASHTLCTPEAAYGVMFAAYSGAPGRMPGRRSCRLTFRAVRLTDRFNVQDAWNGAAPFPEGSKPVVFGTDSALINVELE